MRRVCNCGRLQPCPDHPRLARPGARSPGRDNASHKRFARAVKRRAGGRCERCGAKGSLVAHHRVGLAQGGTDDPANGEALCEACHGLVDPYARPMKP